MRGEGTKGAENTGFNEDEEYSQGKTREEFEMKGQASSNDTLVKLEKTQPEEENKEILKLNNVNVIVRLTLKVRSLFGQWFFGKNSATRVLWIILTNGGTAAILALSIIQYLRYDSPALDFCDGVGFFWILLFLTYLCILYSLIKKVLGKNIRNALEPLCKKWALLKAKKYFCWLCYITPVLSLAAYVTFYPGKSGRRIFSFLGMVVFVIFGFLFSKHPGHIKWRPVISGMVLQFAFGLMTIRMEAGKNVLDCLGRKITHFLQYSEEGSSFVYGFLGKSNTETGPVFAFSILPVVFFLSFFVNLLSYYGALQWLIVKISWVVQLAMGTTVCESVNAAASIFLGMTEAPVLIKSYLKDLTKSEVCAILCAGWSTAAGSVLAAYIKFNVNASHLIAASIMSAPASLSFSKLFYPETEESKNTVGNIVLNKEEATNALDAACKGAFSAILIVSGIIANIIAFLAVIAFLDETLSWIGIITGFEELSFQYIMSKVFYPISFLMGADENCLEDVAYLVGIKTVANEFQAYQKLGEMIKANKLSERSQTIATYALCGFSNFGSIGITVGALSSLEPRQAPKITEVAIHAFIAANIVCFLTACVAGCLID